MQIYVTQTLHFIPHHNHIQHLNANKGMAIGQPKYMKNFEK